jgi:cytoskeleton protein RodZ
MDVVLDATEPTWVALRTQDGSDQFSQLLVPGSPRTIKLQGGVLRTGNAGGLVVQVNGDPLGTIGPRGKIREIEFKDGTYTITAP